MKFLNQCAAFGLAASLLASCSQETPWGSNSGEGHINLHLTALSDVSSAVPDVRAVSAEVSAPPVSDFHVRVSKNDGTMTKTWESVDEFVKDADFSVGVYQIEVFYGDPNTQGMLTDDDEGYEYAYYYGIKPEVTVLEGQTTNVTLEAGLANSIVVIEYSEAFKKYFNDWSTTLQTDGNSPINLGGNEAMNYVIPGNVAINISAEQPNGKEVMLKPGSFKAEAKRMYKMRYNIYDGEIGAAKLAIEFDDNLEQEPIIIDLSKELGNVTPPEVTTEGFESGGNFATLEGTQFDGTIKLNVLARGTIREAILTVDTDGALPSFLPDGFIDLCQATEAQQAEMAAAGVKAVGFYRNPGQMAQLDLSELCHNLKTGTHKFIFQVTDEHSQANEPVEVTIAILPKEISVATSPAPFGEGYADLTISYNGPDPTAPGSNPFTFRLQGDNAFNEANIISINGSALTRSEAFPVHDYVYRIALPEADRDEYPVRIYFNGEEMPELRTNIQFEYPAYNVELDPMATNIRLRTNFADATKNHRFFSKLHVYVNGQRLAANQVVRDNDNCIITVPGLQPSTEYKIQTTLESATTPKTFGSDNTVTTEAAEDVPNGNFSDVREAINITDVQIGGSYLVGFITYTSHTSIVRSEPADWATLNTLTCYSGSTNKNTWFLVPSTYVEDGTVTIVSVGYNHEGTTPSRTGKFGSTTYYNPNAPSESEFVKQAGELFLGNYIFNGSESRTDGISFSSRPSSLTFDYTYIPVNEENAEVYIKLIDGNGDIIAFNETLLTGNQNGSKQLNLENYAFGKKASKLEICFRSTKKGTTPTIIIPSGSDLNEGGGLNTNHQKSANDYKTFASGSKLMISNVKLNY